MKKVVINADAVAAEHQAGHHRIVAPRGQVIVTPGAWSLAHELGMVIDQTPGLPTSAPPSPPAAGPGHAERVVDPSGVVVVKGRTVQLGHFDGAGEGRDVRLTDLVTAADRSPMTAGIMSWAREDSFPWKLGYDEIDYVLEGVLQITIDGRTLEGKTGDVFYLPKGSSLIFGTPSRVRVFYVTYPANWQG